MTLLAPPPRSEHSRARRVAAPLGVIGGLAATTAALAVRDPHVTGSWGLCPSALVGIDCPGCGGLRAVHDLTRLDLPAAASSNLAVVVGIPFAVFFLARWAVDRWRGTRRPASRWTTPLLVLAGVAWLGFTVLRNLPGLEWLAA